MMKRSQNDKTRVQRLRGATAMAVIAGALCAAPDEARADAQDIIPPSTRPMFFTLGIGPTFWGVDRGNDLDANDFGWIFDFGYHLDGGGEGPAIGANIEQTYDDGFYTFNPAFKFWWDFQISDLGIYVAPTGKAGFLVADARPFDAQAAFNIGFGVEGRVVFKDRWMVYLRPVQFDTFVSDDIFGEAFLLAIDVAVGGMVTF
ncbi:MAG: hypothetical protein AAGA56_20020 [Myxococcota bacterium]